MIDSKHRNFVYIYSEITFNHLQVLMKNAAMRIGKAIVNNAKNLSKYRFIGRMHWRVYGSGFPCCSALMTQVVSMGNEGC